MRHADNDNDFIIQHCAVNIQTFQSLVAQYEIRKWQIYRTFDVPATELMLWTKIKEENIACR